MQNVWRVTEAERNQVVRDALRARMGSGQAIALYVLYAIVAILVRLIGGWFALLLIAIFIVVCLAAVTLIWHRQLRGTVRAAYPIGSAATSTVHDGRFRLDNALSSTEIGLDQFHKPRRIGSVVTFVAPGSRLRRAAYPGALVPDDVLSLMH